MGRRVEGVWRRVGGVPQRDAAHPALEGAVQISPLRILKYTR